jgi:hypothetical protein
MEGIPVRYIGKAPQTVPVYMDVGLGALKRALLRSGIDVFDPETVDLLSCLQNVHDAFGEWEWANRLASIARQYDLSTQLVKIEPLKKCCGDRPGFII